LIDNSRVYIALLHYPVYNKTGQVVASAVTNLDLHDLARMTATFGLGGYYVVTPLPLQAKLAQRVMDHWLFGPGADSNWTRKEAFERVRVAPDLKQALEEIKSRGLGTPKLVATTAREIKGQMSFAQFRKMMAEEQGQSFLILFGTGWGITEEFMLSECDRVLEPIRGSADYNHLSVRTAAAIILDRLFSIDRNKF